MEVLVGTGGWDYYPTSEEDRLKAYTRRFSFVEVNSTFYRMPRLSTVRSWRRRVPRDFVFSVKCNREATHVHGLTPIDETFQVLERMLMVCRLLLSEMLVLQTPPSLKVDEDKVSEVSSILKNLNPGRVQVFWEARTPADAKAGHKMKVAMMDEGIVPVLDLSREDSIEGQDIVYSRLFSHGALWYSDELIEKIDRRVTESKAERVVLSFHGASMYRDAVRYLELRQ